MHQSHYPHGEYFAQNNGIILSLLQPFRLYRDIIIYDYIL